MEVRGRFFKSLPVFDKARRLTGTSDERARSLAAIVLIWTGYVWAVELIATAALGNHGGQVPAVSSHVLHGFIDDLAGVPPLARWDSIWFYAIADEGYSGARAESRHTPAFLPLYPVSMRWLASAAGIDFFTAGLWISRLSLLVTLLFLARQSQVLDGCERSEWAAPAALLAFPSAYLLVSVYSESLFLALALAAFSLAQGHRYATASACAFAASLTRIQGVALVAALAVQGCLQWYSLRRSAWCFVPSAAGLAAYAAMVAYCGLVFGDPLYHFAVKRELWGQGLSPPWMTLSAAIDRTLAAANLNDLGSIYALLELPSAYLAALVTVLLLFEGAPRRWPEITFIGCSLGMSLFGGAFGGMPRFTLVLFPVFIALARLHQRRSLWHLYLIAGALLQGCLIINYVGFKAPAP
jgi:hypothetical protein